MSSEPNPQKEETPKTEVTWNDNDSTYDPFALPEEPGKKVPREVPAPTPWLAEKEPNAIQKELIQEVEAQCATIHENLKFYETTYIDPTDLAAYDDTEAEKILKFESKLNPEQWGAALRSKKDLNIKALAGTGKTSLLSAAISYLIATGTPPERIAISSHTVTAAAEIEGRVMPTLAMLFPNAHATLGENRPTAGTIHAIAYREMIAHKHPKSRWTILDEGHQFRIWKEAMLFAFPERATSELDNQTGEEMRLVDRVRGYDIAEHRVPEVLGVLGNSEDLKKIAEMYQKIKEARKLIDYTDLLREFAALACHPGYKNKWDYFFVDEFQDTNPFQKFLLKILKEQGAKLIVCGDNRQSINSFTGSDPTSHESFFEACGIGDAWLETNYRCSKEVIGLANEIISSMSPPEKGRLQPHDDAIPGETTKIIFTKDKNDSRRYLPPKEQEAQKKKEALIACQEAVKMYERLQKEYPDEAQTVALLYRTNAQGGLLEETMAVLSGRRAEKGEKAIPYSRKDYRRTALRNLTERQVLAILGAWAEPERTHWESLLLTPYFRGIGEVTSRTIQRKADKAKPQTASETEEIFEGELTRRNAETVGEFFDAWKSASGAEGLAPTPKNAVTHLENWIAANNSRNTHEAGSKKETEEAQRRAYESGIFERIKAKGAEGKPLSVAIAEIGEENERTAASQNSANRALGLAATNQKVEKEEGIVLSTIHLAKGREYDGVVVHQVARGSLPHFNALRYYENDRNKLEKAFRKYASFPALQDQGAHPDPTTLPPIWRTGIPDGKPKNKIEEWEDLNNPLEEEKRLLYVAVTRAKKLLTLTSSDHNYQFLPKNIWEKLKDNVPFWKDNTQNQPF